MAGVRRVAGATVSEVEERVDWRRIPPVPPEEQPERPERISMSLAKRADLCPRSAYYYLRFGGGAPNVDMVRGTVTHLFAERMMLDLIRAGERTLYAPQERDPDDPHMVAEDRLRAAREVASLTAAIVDEIMGEHPELPLPAADVDDVREMAYHLAVGLDVDPEEVVAVERKFVLELDNGWTISGKIDLGSMPARDPMLLQLDDYKSSFHFPTAEEWERAWQPKFYALLAVYGRPVEKVPCPECGGVPMPAETEGPCEPCGGRGTVEVLLDPIGEHIQRVHARELYPRFLVEKPGRAPRVKSTDVLKPMILTRQDLVDFKVDVERAISRVEHGLETGEWQPLPSEAAGHCSECAGRMICPIPAWARRYAGAINRPEQATEAKAWADVMGARVEATKREIRNYLKGHGEPIEAPAPGQQMRLETVEGKKLKQKGGRTDWDGLTAAIAAAAWEGQPFDMDDWVKTTTSTKMVVVKIEGAESNGADAAAAVDPDERWGVDAPF